MHVHAPHNVSVADKATTPTGPIPSSRLLPPVAPWTVAAGSPLTAAEAHDADLCTLLLEIVFIFAVLPLAHALVVMTPFVLAAHSVRIAHIEHLHLLRLTEVDHPVRALVPQVAHAPGVLAACARPCILQAPPALGAFVTAGLQTSELAQRHVVLPLEAADAASGHDQSLAARGGEGHLVDFA